MPTKFQSMKNVKKTKVPSGDGLKLMLKYQALINQNYYPIVFEKLGEWPTKKPFSITLKQLLTKEYLLAIMRECVEALDQINSKPWKQSEFTVDSNELKFEFADIQHFINTLYDIWEMDAKEVMQYYFDKNGENKARIERKY